MPVQRLSPQERRASFEEVDRPYDREAALAEAARCIRCAHPFCEEGCPARSPIRTWIERLAAGDVDGAFDSMSTVSSLPAICGRVCPVERQCEGACVLGRKAEPIAIGMLERFVGDEAIGRGPVEDRALRTGRRVAIVGSGPAGLAAAGALALRGHGVTVLEALPLLGGVLAWGIPSFVLPRIPLRAELERLDRLGVRFRARFRIGDRVGVDDLLRAGFDAVLLAVGASDTVTLGIPGEGLRGVYSATDYLMLATTGRDAAGRRVALPARGARVVVVGGGDTAIDVARTAVRLRAADVRVLYRRGLAHMPARREAVMLAVEEGVLVEERTVVRRILGTTRLEALECAPTSLGGTDASGRPAPVAEPSGTILRLADAMVVAVGYRPEGWLTRTGLPLRDDATIIADTDGRTSRPGVFAAGDVVHGPDRVVTAMAAGRRAASAIHAYMRSEPPAMAPSSR